MCTKIICTHEIVINSKDIPTPYPDYNKISVGDTLIITEKVNTYGSKYRVKYFNNKEVNWILDLEYFKSHFKTLTQVRKEKLTELGI